MALIISSGESCYDVVFENSSLIVIDGGIASSTTFNVGGSLTVSSGGTANSTTVNSGGRINVSSGGTATGIMENGGYVKLYDDAYATFIANTFSGLVLSSASATVHSGTTAIHTEVYSEGFLAVSSGGLANNATVQSNGWINVYDGGSLKNAVAAKGGRIYAYTGGVADLTTVNSGGSFYLGLAGYGVGGTATRTTVNSGGSLFVSQGGTAVSTTINSGEMVVSSGGTATRTTINGGRLFISATGSADSITVNSGGRVTVFYGTATNLIENGGYVEIYSDATVSVSFVSNTFSGPIQQATVHSGTTANSVIVGSHCGLNVVGGLATGTRIDSWGSMYVASGGTASNTINNIGQFFIYRGGYASGIVVSGQVDRQEGDIYVSSGGLAENVTIGKYGDCYVSSGASANRIMVSANGNLEVYSGGTATNITENGGYVLVEAGANVAFLSNTVSGLLLNNDSASVHSGTTANRITVSSGGSLHVFSGGTANSATVYGSGEYTVFSKGIANEVKVYAGGSLKVSSGGTLTGRMNFAMGAIVSMEDHAILNFDLTQASAGAKALLNDWSLIQGTPDCVITVGSEQADGIYNLADNADDFEGTISVKNAFGGSLGTLTVGQTFDIDYVNYSLSVEDGTLQLTIEKTGEVISGTRVISSGQTSSGLIVDERGSLIVGSGGTANESIVDEYGRMNIYSGGVANDTIIHSNGHVSISAGGTANGTVVNGGHLYVDEGGTATNVYWTPCEGYVSIEDGAVVTFASQYSGVYLGSDNHLVSQAATMFDQVVDEDSEMLVMSGGTAKHTQVLEYGRLEVFSGGTATDASIINGGRMYVSSGGTAYNITIGESDEGNGLLAIESGGMADDIMVCGGVLDVSSGGTATNVYWTPCEGHISIEDGAVVTLASQYSGVYLGSNNHLISNTTLMFGKEIGEFGEMLVMSGGTAKRTTVDEYGEMYVSSGGTANDVVVEELGYMYVRSGGTATNVTASSGAILFIDVASGTYVQGTSGGKTFEMKDAFLSGYDIEYGGIDVFSGGTATDIFAINGGIDVSSGGVANNIVLNAEDGMAWLDISGGMANNITANQSGWIWVSSGAMISNTVLNDSGSFLQVFRGAIAIDTTVNDGRFDIWYGAVASNVTVNFGPMEEPPEEDFLSRRVLINAGGKLTGRMTFNSEAVVSASYGAIIDFDLTQTSAGAAALVNNLSIISGAPDYTLTVSGSQENGTYLLAESASEFNGTISVVNALGESLGTLTVGETVVIGYNDYLLELDGGTLSVTVSGGTPEPVDASFFPGCFAGGSQALLAVQKDRDVTIYVEDEVFGSGLTLDPGWEIVGVGDFNGDGRDDLLRVNDEGYVVGEMTKITASFAPQVLNFKGEGWDILGIGDFNGNGADDVLVANPTGASETVGLLGYWEGGVTWTLINGYSAEWECVSTGDFNGDGKCDMLWRNSFEGEGGLTYNAYCTWIMDDPVDWRMVSVANPDEWNFLCAGDFDGNGSHDIAMINDVGVVGIWGISDGYLNSWSILSAVNPAEWTLAGVADFNGDGTDDIAWCSNTTGLAGYWQINDKQLTAWQNIATIA